MKNLKDLNHDVAVLPAAFVEQVAQNESLLPTGRVKIQWVADPKQLKSSEKAGNIIIKLAEVTGTFGLPYDHSINNIVTGMEKGKTIQVDANGKAFIATGSLPHGQTWLIPNKLISSKDGSTHYLRIIPDRDSIKTKWFLNGVEVSKADLVAGGHLKADPKPTGGALNDTPPCMILKTGSIIGFQSLQ